MSMSRYCHLKNRQGHSKCPMPNRANRWNCCTAPDIDSMDWAASNTANRSNLAWTPYPTSDDRCGQLPRQPALRRNHHSLLLPCLRCYHSGSWSHFLHTPRRSPLETVRYIADQYVTPTDSALLFRCLCFCIWSACTWNRSSTAADDRVERLLCTQRPISTAFARRVSDNLIKNEKRSEQNTFLKIHKVVAFTHQSSIQIDISHINNQPMHSRSTDATISVVLLRRIHFHLICIVIEKCGCSGHQ